MNGKKPTDSNDGDSEQPPPPAPKGPVDNPEHGNDKRNNYVKHAKKGFAEPIVWFTAALVIVSGFQWNELRKADITARKALDVYRGQLKVTQDQLEGTKKTIAAFEKLANAADRTASIAETQVIYIPEGAADRPLTYDGDIQTSVRLSLKKTGSLPIDISIAYRVFLLAPAVKQDHRAQEQDACMKGQRISRRILIVDGYLPVAINIVQADITKGKHPNGDIHPVIVGCIEYSHGNQRKFTGFTALIRKTEGPLNLNPGVLRSLEYVRQRITDRPQLMPDEIYVEVSSNYVR